MSVKLAKWLCRLRCRWPMLVIIGLIVVLVLLQFLHMLLLSRLESKEAEVMQRREEDAIRNNLKQYDRISRELLGKISIAHQLDTSGSYTIIENVAGPDIDFSSLGNEEENMDVSFVTQATYNNLYHLVQLSQFWDGPISVTVFTYDEDIVPTLFTIAFLKVCFQAVHKTTTFHLVFPLAHPLKNARDVLNMEIDCRESPMSLMKHPENYDIKGIEYPHNILRNVAKKYSKNKFILVCDIDIIPSRGLRENFVSFVLRRQLSTSQIFTEPIVFVIPSFETEKSSVIPTKKRNLIQAWDQRTVRPFYWDVCWKCQKHTHYERWKQLPDIDVMDVGYYAEWRDPWEPFYIAEKSVPDYDERFKQYGFNRISQVCEVHVAGHHFAVLNSAFLIHKGFKILGKFHSGKEEEMDRNRALFGKFKNELRDKYPDTDRQC